MRKGLFIALFGAFLYSLPCEATKIGGLPGLVLEVEMAPDEPGFLINASKIDLALKRAGYDDIASLRSASQRDLAQALRGVPVQVGRQTTTLHEHSEDGPTEIARILHEQSQDMDGSKQVTAERLRSMLTQ